MSQLDVPDRSRHARMTLVLGQEQAHWLRRRHRELGISPSFTIRRALDAYRGRLGAEPAAPDDPMAAEVSRLPPGR